MSWCVARQSTLLFVLLVVAGVTAGCGSSNTVSDSTTSTGVTGSVVMFAQDAPADNIVKVELLLTGVTFNPGGVSALASPKELELTTLQMSPQLIRLAPNIPTGSYTSIQLTFGPTAEVKFLNSGTGSIQEVDVPVNPAMVTVNVNFSVVNGQTSGLLLDFNLANSLVTGAGGAITGFNPQVTASVMNVSGVQGEFEDEVGRVVSVNAGNSTFVFEPFSNCQQVTIQTTSSTEFEDFDEANPPRPNSFAGLLANQIVEVEADLRSDGTLVAEEVELADEAMEEELEGIITAATRNASDQVTQFQMILLEVVPCSATPPASDTITVNVPTSGVSFRIDDDGFTVNSSLFDNSADLEVGQNVEVDPTGAIGTTVTAEEIELEDQTIRGTVISTAGVSFDLDPNSDLFPDQSITVQTITGQTEFEDLPLGVGSLSGGQAVRVKGLLFRPSLGVLQMLAKKVDGTP